MTSVTTTSNRVLYVTSALIGTSIAAVVGIYLGISSPSIVHTIQGNTYTDAEYQQIKADEINIINNRAVILPTFKEVEIWEEILVIECGSITLHNVKSDIVIDQLNNYLSNGCKE